ncbi:MAG: hypothetical protein PVJ80_03810 [Gemmatimonadota bacterium]|jgi:hypothetical protein
MHVTYYNGSAAWMTGDYRVDVLASYYAARTRIPTPIATRPEAET